VTADATEDAVGAVASGLLQTDGAMVEVQPFSTHVSELAKVRGIRFKRVASGAIGFSADAGSAPSESGVVRLGYRAGDVNNLERPAWAWKPARELFQKLVARGRRRRQGDGLTVTPRYLVRSSQRTVAAVGAVEPRIIDCPMVRTPEALEREPGADTFEPMRPVCSTTIGG
jgi:hypothetical protein